MSYEVQKMGKLYYKSVDVTWWSPNISANGTLGGSTFAVYTNYIVKKLGTALWQCFSQYGSGISATSNTSGYFTIYNPIPIKFTCFNGSINWSGGTVYGSNDNTNWTQLGTFTFTTIARHDINVSATGYYKYIKFAVNGGLNGEAPFLGGYTTIMGYTQATEVVNTPDYTSTVDIAKGYEIITSDGKVYEIEKGV